MGTPKGFTTFHVFKSLYVEEKGLLVSLSEQSELLLDNL